MEGFGQRAVDYFSRQSHSPYEHAETLEDVGVGLNMMRTLFRVGRFQEAADVYRGDLARALLFNLEAHSTTLALLRPFFPHGWGNAHSVRPSTACYLINAAGIAFDNIGDHVEALDAYAASLSIAIADGSKATLFADVCNVASALIGQDRIAEAERCGLLALELASFRNEEAIFKGRLFCFDILAVTGRVFEAEALWNLIDPMGRDWLRATYRPGDAEWHYARFRYYQGSLSDPDIVRARTLAQPGRNRRVTRWLHALRGAWRLDHGHWDDAAASLQEAIRMAHEVNQSDEQAAAQLALANLRLGRLPGAREMAEQLSTARRPSHVDLAALWLAIGDREQAKTYALAAYKIAWADGEPYVFRFDLNRAKALLVELGVKIPDLPPHDPQRHEKFPWEKEVEALIEQLRAEKAKEAKKPKSAKAAKRKGKSLEGQPKARSKSKAATASAKLAKRRAARETNAPE
jgi:tetratricopeptide (TPR) repeat protein